MRSPVSSRRHGSTRRQSGERLPAGAEGVSPALGIRCRCHCRDSGGPDGAALVGVASIMMGTIVNRATIHTIHPVHRKLLATSARMCLWLGSVVGQAFARNSHIMITMNHFNAAGPGENMLLHEVAANAITASVSGMHLGPGPASAQSKYTDHVSGLEGILMVLASLASFRVNIRRSMPMGHALTHASHSTHLPA